MMTTLRTNRRTRRNAMFNLECLDERIVLSAAGAAAHIAALIDAGHFKAAAVIERHEARLEARAEASPSFRIAHPPSPTPSGPIEIPIPVSPVPWSGVASQAMPSSTTSTGTASNANANALITAAPASIVPATTATPTVTTAPPSTSTSTSTTSSTGTTVTLPPNVSSQLQSLYAQYESYLSTNSSGTFTPTGLNTLIIKGNDVGINFETSDSADFNTILGQLQSDGMQIVSSSSTYGVVEGMLPIAQLPAVAQLPSASVTPMYPVMMH